MMGVALVIFIIADGGTRLNTAPEGAIGRGILVAALVVAWLAWLWRAGIHFQFAGAFLVGVLAAYTISESYWRVGGVGISTWLLYAGMYFAQAHIRRDWHKDMAIAGIILSGLVLMAVPSGPPQGGMLNRNMLAGALVALAPAALSLRAKSGLAELVKVTAVMAAIALIGSRGAWVATAVGLFVLIRPRRISLAHCYEYLGCTYAVGTFGAVAGGSLALTMLVVIRPVTFFQRFDCAYQVLRQWLATSPIGPPISAESEHLHVPASCGV